MTKYGNCSLVFYFSNEESSRVKQMEKENNDKKI